MRVATEALSHRQCLISTEGRSPYTVDRAICTHTPTSPAGIPGTGPYPTPLRVKARSVKGICGLLSVKRNKGKEIKTHQGSPRGSWWEAEKELGEIFYSKIKEDW